MIEVKAMRIVVTQTSPARPFIHLWPVECEMQEYPPPFCKSSVYDIYEMFGQDIDFSQKQICTKYSILLKFLFS